MRMWSRALVVGMLCAACATGNGVGADGGPTDAAPPPIDGHPLDALPPPSAITDISPGMVVVSHGKSTQVTVTLDRPAVNDGAHVMLSSPDDPTGAVVTFPAEVVVGPGQSTAAFTVMSVAQGGPIDLRATYGGTHVDASVVVVPAIAGLSPPMSNVVVGTGDVHTLSLDAVTAVDVTVTLASSSSAVANAPAMVTVPAGSSSATFAITGASLGVATVTASIGTDNVSTTARVVGLYLSEIFYDPTGTDSTWEWIELWNGSAVSIDATGVRVQEAVTAGAYVDTLTLAGSVMPGQCVVVGGPMTGPTNFTAAGFTFFLAQDFSPDLGNAGTLATDPADGLQLVAAGGGVIDNVIYGRNNNDMITDETGAIPAVPDGPDVPTAHSLERTAPGLGGPWIDQAAPNPGTCTAISM